MLSESKCYYLQHYDKGGYLNCLKRNRIRLKKLEFSDTMLSARRVNDEEGEVNSKWTSPSRHICRFKTNNLLLDNIRNEY